MIYFEHTLAKHRDAFRCLLSKAEPKQRRMMAAATNQVMLPSNTHTSRTLVCTHIRTATYNYRHVKYTQVILTLAN